MSRILPFLKFSVRAWKQKAEIHHIEDATFNTVVFRHVKVLHQQPFSLCLLPGLSDCLNSENGDISMHVFLAHLKNVLYAHYLAIYYSDYEAISLGL